jgi:hypothetical protein
MLEPMRYSTISYDERAGGRAQSSFRPRATCRPLPKQSNGFGGAEIELNLELIDEFASCLATDRRLHDASIDLTNLLPAQIYA